MLFDGFGALVLAEAPVGGLVHHEVLRLNHHQEQQRDEEEGAHADAHHQRAHIVGLRLPAAEYYEVLEEAAAAASCLLGLQPADLLGRYVDVNVHEGHGVNENEVEGEGRDVKVEERVVPGAHAVVYPLAVMVEPFNAVVANVTMTRL